MSMDDDIKKALIGGKLVVGLGATLNGLKLGKVSKVYLSSNCPDNTKKDLERYSKIAKIEFKVLGISNEELGVLCKKPFSISVLGIAGNGKK